MASDHASFNQSLQLLEENDMGQALKVLRPFLEQMADLKDTVSTLHPGWSVGQVEPNFIGVNHKYTVITNLLAATMQAIAWGVNNNNDGVFQWAGQQLVSKQEEPNFQILLGDQPSLMSESVYQALGHSSTQETVVSAMADIARRLNQYLAPY